MQGPERAAQPHWATCSGPCIFVARPLGEWLPHVFKMSQTMLMSEVKNYTPYVSDCGRLSIINDPENVPSPNVDPMTVAPEYLASGCSLSLITPTLSGPR